MSRWLLLLKLQLSLLHFLQHLLRCLHSGLIRRAAGCCSASAAAWSACLSVFSRAVVGIVASGSAAPCSGRRELPSCGTIPGCCCSATDVPLGSAPTLSWSGFCHQHHARQHSIVRRRSKQHIVEPRSIQQVRHDFPRRSRSQMGHHPLRRRREFQSLLQSVCAQLAKCRPA